MTSTEMRNHMKERFFCGAEKDNYSLHPSLPQSLNIELNSTCNHVCEFCFWHGKYSHKLKPAIMPLLDAKNILRQAKELGIGEKEVGFYLTGEVFLYKDFPEVVRYAKDLGFKYTFITTNGSLAVPEKMKAVLDAGLDSIRFSINAADRETYKEVHGKDDFDAVCENLKYMHDYIKSNSLNVATSISCVITKKTNGIQNKIKELFGDLVDDILFMGVMTERLDCGEDYKEENSMSDIYSRGVQQKTSFCPLLFNTIYINAELKVLPCCKAFDTNCFFYDLRQDFNLEHAWNSESYLSHRDIFLNGKEDIGTICHDCSVVTQLMKSANGDY